MKYRKDLFFNLLAVVGTYGKNNQSTVQQCLENEMKDLRKLKLGSFSLENPQFSLAWLRIAEKKL